MTHPYENLPSRAFWRTAVANCHASEISELWNPKFQIRPGHRIATAGSCFAQHFAAALRLRKYKWIDGEPGPRNASKFATNATHKRFNYGVFSFRTGNIYTPNMLLQWLKWAYGLEEPQERYWEMGGRFYDPFRPAVEPNGFASVDDLERARAYTLSAIKNTLEQAHFFVFTLGLTEGWRNRETGEEYATCPGVHAGVYDEVKHEFVNYNSEQTKNALTEALALISRGGGTAQTRFLLTVSPVPLTATASGEHVLTATMRSKSVLRAVAGEVSHGSNIIDYFPSYEIIASHPFKGYFFEPNLRSVNQMGVDLVMNTFFKAQEAKAESAKSPTAMRKAALSEKMSSMNDVSAGMEADNLVCEEMALDAFAR